MKRYGLPHNRHWAYLVESGRCVGPANVEGLHKVQPGNPEHALLSWLTPPPLQGSMLVCKHIRDSYHAEPPRLPAGADVDELPEVPSKLRAISVAPIEPRSIYATEGALALSLVDAILFLSSKPVPMGPRSTTGTGSLRLTSRARSTTTMVSWPQARSRISRRRHRLMLT